MRLATEAGEHRHYLNMTYFYQHTLRGDVVVSVAVAMLMSSN